MNAKVIIAYIDRDTKKPHFKGETVSLSQARASELAALGYVKPIEEAKPAKRTSKKE